MKEFLDNRYVLTCGLSVVVRACPRDAEVHHLSTSSSSRLSGRAPATSQRKIKMHRIKVFFRDPALPPRRTASGNERSMDATAKDTISTASPAHHSLPPLSLPATDLVSRVQIKSLPLVLRATERVIIALTLKLHGAQNAPFSI